MFLQGLVFVNVSKEMSTKESRNEWWAAKWKCFAPHFPCFHSCFVCSISSLSLYVHLHPFISNAEGSYLKYKSIPFLPFQIQKYRKCRTSCIKELSISSIPRKRNECARVWAQIWEMHKWGRRSLRVPSSHRGSHDTGTSLLSEPPILIRFCNFSFFQDPFISSLYKWME